MPEELKLDPKYVLRLLHLLPALLPVHLLIVVIKFSIGCLRGLGFAPLARLLAPHAPLPVSCA